MGKYGITYRGKHSSELGLIAKVITKPAAPPVRVVEETVPYRDGTVDYSERGGRLFYDDKVMEIEFKAISPELSQTELLISKAVGWLMGGYGDLILDSAPLTKWIAKPIELSEIATELYRVGSFTVQFRCKPFNQLILNSEPLTLDTEISIDSPVALNWGSFGRCLGDDEDYRRSFFVYGDTLAKLSGIKMKLREDTSRFFGVILMMWTGSRCASIITPVKNDDGILGKIPAGAEFYVDMKSKTVTGTYENGDLPAFDYMINAIGIEGDEEILLKPGEVECTVSGLQPLDYSIIYTPQYFYVNSELEAAEDE